MKKFEDHESEKLYLKNMIFFGNFIQIGLILHGIPPYTKSTKLGLPLLVHTTTK